MRRRNVDILVIACVAFVFLFLVPVVALPEYQTKSQSCSSASASESNQTEPEAFEPCVSPEFGSVTYYALGAGGVWMEDEYAHSYVVCLLGTTDCS